MKTYLGESGLDKSWQSDFEKEVKCVHCDGVARIAFVGMEEPGSLPPHVCDLHSNKGGEGGNFWVHDSIAVGVYLCKKCLGVTAIMNQA